MDKNISKDILARLNDVLKKLKYNFSLPQGEFDDLRVINGEYVASRMGATFDRNNYTCIQLYRESGITEIRFKPKTKISANNIQYYDDHSILHDGTRKRIWIDHFPKSLKGYGMLEEKDGIINGIMAISSCERVTFTHKLDENHFQPSGCNLELYSKSTGLPVIENNLFLIDKYKSLDKINRDEFSCIPRNADTCAYLSIHSRLKVNKTSPNTMQQQVICLYVTREDFLSGQKPVIIVFEDNNDKLNNGIYRLLADGSYIDNSTYIEENGICTFKTCTFEELITKSNGVLQPVDRTIMNAARGKFQNIIPQEYIDLYSELLGQVKSESSVNSDVADTVVERELITINPTVAVNSALKDGITSKDILNVKKQQSYDERNEGEQEQRYE